MTVIVHHVELACVRQNRACDPLGGVGTSVRKKDAQYVLFPAASLEVQSGNVGSIEPDFTLRIVPGPRQSHQSDGMPALQERVAEAHDMLTQATQPRPRYVFADEQYFHERRAAGKWSRRTTKSRLAAT